jgi:VanZ family protein
MRYNLLISILWTIFIIVGSIISGETLDNVSFLKIPHLDKVIHFLWYFVLFILWYSFLLSKNYKFVSLSYRLIVFLVLSAFGLMMEIVQKLFASHRYFEINDLLFNILGLFLGLLFFFPIYQNKFFGRFL